MRVLETCSLRTTTRVPGSQSRWTQVKKVRKNDFKAENELYSFDQPMRYRYKRMAGVIEHLDVFQCF